MAKGDKDKAAADKASTPSDKADEAAAAWDAIPEALRDAGKRAAEMAQNPYARSLLAAGLVAAAAALASNKNVREATRRNVRSATEAAEIGADNAGKIGVAIVNAATEAVQRMLNLGGVAAAGEAPAGEAPPAKTSAPKPAPRKRAAPSAPKAAKPKPAAAATPKPRVNKAPAKTASTAKVSKAGASAPAAGRKRTPKGA